MSNAADELLGTITVAIGDFSATGNTKAFDVLFQYYRDTITRKAEYYLRFSKTAMLGPDDVVNVIMLELGSKLKLESSWVVKNATDREALLKIIGRMTFLRCCKILRYEKARPATRVGDISEDSDASCALFIDRENANWEVDFKLTLEEIENGLNRLDAGFRAEELVRVFRGMQLGESNKELAKAIGKSLQTVTRIKRIIRTLASDLLKSNQDDCFYGSDDDVE